MEQADRRSRTQAAVRVAGLAFVVAWLFSDVLRAEVPYWLPFAVLAATEAEFLLRGLLGARDGAESAERRRERRLPGERDADLGWPEDGHEEDGSDEGDVEEEVDEDALAEPVAAPDELEPDTAEPPPAAPPAHRWPGLGYVAGTLVAVALFVVAWRLDARETWGALSPSARAAAEARFASEAGRIAGRPVTILCDEDYDATGAGTDTAGVAFPARSLALLEPSVCRTLHDLAFAGEAGAVDDTAWAIVVLAHEAVHLRGVHDEALTECYALQEGSALGERLGLSRPDAARLMRFQLDRALGDRSVARAGYRPPAGCRDGGPLDLRPEDPSFP